ncbi:para-aminobenzoate synthase [Phlegmacium glaucopus]|nr:para-aminobenzoate synthase [Phlegmacium glaucopus]
MEYPKLLLIDSYDSFTHNLASLCQQAIPNSSVFIIKNDQFNLKELLPYLSYFSAVIVGPGPGSPDVPEDIGLVKDLWKLREHDIIPIFGVCLGLQSLGLAFGALLKRLDAVKHGQISHIYHQGIDLFDNVGSVRAVRYHSLHVVLQQDGDVEELAWANDMENGKVTMAVRHKCRPFWAVQYHPESVCTEGGGIQVIRNFWRLAQTWAKVTSRRTLPWNTNLGAVFGHHWPYLPAPSPPRSSNTSLTVITSAVKRLGLSVTDVCESMGAFEESSSFVLLDSAAYPGRFSVVGCLSSSSLLITYRVGDRFVSLTRDGRTASEELGTQDIWSWLATLMHSKKAVGGHAGLPFWGGLIGYLSYELGVSSIKVDPREDECIAENQHPDVNLVFVDRSVVLDAETSKTFVQSILPGDEDWIAKTIAKLETLSSSPSTTDSLHSSTNANITLPDKAHYVSRIKECQEHLFAGDSYELCLTAQTRVSISDVPSSATSISWERYKRLRKSNPAPHSAYLRLHPSTLLSSSPERFLSFSRPPGTVCQLRPIKGTVRKAPNITRAIAEQSLVGSPKEVAENLMIVDLIRHDLHGVVGDDVMVPQFCVVEEYETVWQLVSVIEGKLNPNAGLPANAEDQLGWQVLKQSLPAGSMTGAPKKRSVAILQSLEGNRRNIYSGVFGYWCVGGSGDWSVTIRSCYKYDEKMGSRPSDSEEWMIGAGGAITALSDPESEWDEMMTKLHSVLRAFGALSPSAV